MPVASLPSEYGIGDLGSGCRQFIDLLKKSGISIWQILPLNPLGYGNSPYQPYSSFAGDELYLSLSEFYQEGLIKTLPAPFMSDSGRIDYQAARDYKAPWLYEAFSNFVPDTDYEKFIAQEWVYQYAVFLTFKKKNSLRCWNEWPDEYKNWILDRAFDETVYEKEIRYEMFLQYEFQKQWKNVKRCANEAGIQIMGDLPFYVGIDSLDVWAGQKNFLIGADGQPVFIAGVPPDYFSATGQRWGNPIYDWAYMEKDQFSFWFERLRYNSTLFDILRIDHFRAFDTYWKIPASCETAVVGEWAEAPGYRFFDELRRRYPNMNIVAEDLGDMRREVYELRDHYQFAGMKIIQFVFDPNENNNNFEDRKNMLVYTGTHDNQTIQGWFESQDYKTRLSTDLYLASLGYRDDSIAHRFIRYAFDSVADYALVPVQDVLSLGDKGRLNTPGTLGSPNWEWRLKDMSLLEKQTDFIKEAVDLSGRNQERPEFVPEQKKESLEQCLKRFLMLEYGKDEISECSDDELYTGLLLTVKYLAGKKESGTGKKKLYYISAEFLIGKLLSNNLINLGIYEEARELLAAHGRTLTDIAEAEPEPSLGNGGLGRLAACFLDSIATLGLNGDGMGLNYHFGLFKQSFQKNLQHEEPNPWISAQSWLTDTGKTYEVRFGSHAVTSVLYDIDVTGYDNRTNKLHLFDIKTVDESLVTEGIDFDKTDIDRNLTLFLYPDDSDDAGRLLRVYQQYFMVSSAAQYILDECAAKGSDLHDLADYAVIQINDTHPTMVIPELIRLLCERGLEFDEAVEVVSKTCAYTNHTILAEALEKWPVKYLKQVVPQLMPIIEILDDRVRRRFQDESVSIIDRNDRVHMAHIDIHYGFSVNGVAALHTEILKENELNNFYRLYPEKFNNKTNGITFRRWLLHCNHALTALIEELIGDGFKKDASELTALGKFVSDETVLSRLLAIKQHNKRKLVRYIKDTEQVEIDENSIFDIQIKRLHEYKRQQMNALYIIHKYLEIKKGNLPKRPITEIFGAKAAPAYVVAKDIIHVILCLSRLINSDPEVSPYLKVVMVENYNVSKAELLIPACDLSEQISLASKEASGTGNMKFMLNGAVTLGTMDGANVEIEELVGEDNIYIFGEKSEQVIGHYENKDYVSKEYYDSDPDIKEMLDFLVGPEMQAIGDGNHLNNVYHELLTKDWFMTLLDLKEYIRVKEQAFSDYEDRMAWAKKMLVNISQAGFFSSDRTIAEYNRDVWKLEGVMAAPVKKISEVPERQIFEEPAAE